MFTEYACCVDSCQTRTSSLYHISFYFHSLSLFLSLLTLVSLSLFLHGKAAYSSMLAETHALKFITLFNVLFLKNFVSKISNMRYIFPRHYSSTLQQPPSKIYLVRQSLITCRTGWVNQ